MYPNTGEMPADPKAFPACVGVLDLVYNPRRTALLLRAEELGIPCADGLSMLVAQAKAAEELFFDREIDERENERIIKLLRRSMQNIVLIGMPGSGKTTIGAALGRLTGRRVVDLDEQIIRIADKSIAEIFAASGEEVFRALEREQALFWGRESGLILVTGGGIVKDKRNYPALRQNGRIYLVERALDQLARIGRPLSAGADLERMQRERAPLYVAFRNASLVNNATPEEAAERIWNEFCDRVD
ncbi:Shikimate kinase [bioreactor metagenome]|uniref:Shikimate kinase n=1 Tax=bioreactor metagenome TaxID=1076179 RepID=A0A645EU59_9ZZZZ